MWNRRGSNDTKVVFIFAGTFTRSFLGFRRGGLSKLPEVGETIVLTGKEPITFKPGESVSEAGTPIHLRITEVDEADDWAQGCVDLYAQLLSCFQQWRAVDGTGVRVLQVRRPETAGRHAVPAARLCRPLLENRPHRRQRVRPCTCCGHHACFPWNRGAATGARSARPLHGRAGGVPLGARVREALRGVAPEPSFRAP